MDCPGDDSRWKQGQSNLTRRLSRWSVSRRAGLLLACWLVVWFAAAWVVEFVRSRGETRSSCSANAAAKLLAGDSWRMAPSWPTGGEHDGIWEMAQWVLVSSNVTTSPIGLKLASRRPRAGTVSTLRCTGTTVSGRLVDDKPYNGLD